MITLMKIFFNTKIFNIYCLYIVRRFDLTLESLLHVVIFVFGDENERYCLNKIRLCKRSTDRSIVIFFRFEDFFGCLGISSLLTSKIKIPDSTYIKYYF